MTKTIRQILETKSAVHSVRPQDTVFDALKLMAEKNIGALVVLEGKDLAGIFSERDYARKVVLQGKSSRDLPVSEIMTRKVVTIDPERTAGDCMALMTDQRIRHLPVIEEGALIGVISIGDVVRAVVEDQQFTIKQLETYIGSGG